MASAKRGVGSRRCQPGSAARASRTPQSSTSNEATWNWERRCCRTNSDALNFLLFAYDYQDVSELLRRMSVEHKDRVLEPLLHNSFQLQCHSSAARQRSVVFSVQSVALGLMKLTSGHKLDAATDSSKRDYFKVVFESPFTSAVLQHISSAALIEDGWRERATTPPQWTPSCPAEALLIACEFVDAVCVNVHEACGSDQFHEWTSAIGTCRKRIKRSSFYRSEQTALLLDACKRLETQFQAYIDSIDTQRLNVLSAAEKSQHSRDQALAQSLWCGERIPPEVPPGPGWLFSDEGAPRHDNDFVDFREISIMPTAQEVECVHDSHKKPWLPKRSVDMTYTGNSVDKLLDINFRLLRHELLYPLTIALSCISQAFSGDTADAESPAAENHTSSPRAGKSDEAEWLAKLRRQLASKCPVLRDLQLVGQGTDKVTLTVLYNVSFYSFAANLREGVTLQLSFDVPVLHGVQSNVQQWLRDRGSRFFSNTQLGILYSGESQQFCLISPVGEPSYDEKSGQIMLEFSLIQSEGKRFLTFLSSQYHHWQPPERRPANPLTSKTYVFLVPSVFFPMIHPILQGLQKMTLQHFPLADCLAEEDHAAVLAPAYSSGRLQTIGVDSLDAAQRRAYFHALQNNVTIIQGPPGTGKTYLGVHIVKTLLDARNRRCVPTPILIVCYTNHALDQFLQELVDNGALPLKDIVRIGGNCKSDMLKQQQFMAVIKRASKGDKLGGQTIARVKGQANSLEREINSYAQARKLWLPWRLVKDFYESCDEATTSSILRYTFGQPFEVGFAYAGSPRSRYNSLVASFRSMLSTLAPQFRVFEEQAVTSAPFPASRPCEAFLFSRCSNSSGDCPDGSHDEQWKRYKKEVCRHWIRTGYCKYASKCRASKSHLQRLLPRIHFPSGVGYPCPYLFGKHSSCKYGSRCRWSHDDTWQDYKQYFCFHYLRDGACERRSACPKSLQPIHGIK